MSNIGIFYYNNINSEKVEIYIRKILDTILVRKPKRQIFKRYSEKELCGLINWGAYPVTYTKMKNTYIFFDGYILDKEPNNGTELIRDLYNKHGINFIEKIPFFGNILIKTPESVYIITSYHALFELYCYISKDIFCVAPAIKLIFPIANQNQTNVNEKTVVELLSLEHSLNTKTLYNEIVKLDSSSVYIYDPKENKCIRRFYKPYVNRKLVNYISYLKDVEDLYEDAISKVINPLDKNYKISLCFSGGTDSSYLLSHLIRKNIPVTTYTHIKNRGDRKLLKLIQTVRRNYPNIETKLVEVENYNFLDFEKLTKKYEQLIDLQEIKRLQKDLHLVDLHKAFDSNSIFTEGTVGDVIMAASKLNFLIAGTKNGFFRKLEKVSSYFLPNEVILFLLKRFSSMVKPSDYYIQQIKKHDWPPDIINNIKIEIDHSYEAIRKKYNLANDNIKQFELYIIENRIYGYMNDHCYVGRNYNEYFLSPFYENDFFNYVLSIDYSKKFNAKLNYDLNKKDSYFYNIPIANTNKTIESSFFKYRLDRNDPLHLFVSWLKYIALKQETKPSFKVDLNTKSYIRELLSKCSWNHLISEAIFKNKISEVYYILLFEKRMKEYYELYNRL